MTTDILATEVGQELSAEIETETRKRRKVAGWIAPALAIAALLVLLSWVFFPGLMTGHSPSEGVPSDKFLGPSLTHWFGTDFLGRDVYARVVYGTPSSLVSALSSVTIALTVGAALGALAALGPRWIDTLVGRFADILFAIPGFLLALIIVTSLGFSTRNAAIAVGVASIPLFVRQTRSEVLRVKNLNFIESSYLVGGTPFTTTIRHIVPNIYRGILALVVINFGYSLIAIAGLAFLGYADPPPASDWGILLSEGQEYISIAPWIVYFPGLIIVLTVLTFNQLSRLIGGRR